MLQEVDDVDLGGNVEDIRPGGSIVRNWKAFKANACEKDLEKTELFNL